MRTNKHVTGPVTPEGGAAIPLESPHRQLARLTSCCMLWEKNFYYEGEDIANRIKAVVMQCKPSFVMQHAHYLRNSVGLRHVPLWLMACLSKHPSKPVYGFSLPQLVVRPDDVTELLAMIFVDGDRRKGGKLPKQIQRGLAKAFGKFDEYQLAKYNRTGLGVNLVEALKLLHPKPKDDSQSALWKRLKDNNLAVPATWEVALSANVNKKDAFTDLLCENKLGGLALLRNLRTMIQAGVDDRLLSQRIMELAENKRPIMPHQFIAAWRHATRFEKELEYAMMRNLEKMDKLQGKTILMVDVSGSMGEKLSNKSEMLRRDVAAGLAVMTRAVCEQYRVYTFSNSLVEINPAPNGFRLINAIDLSQYHAGTDLGGALEAVRETTATDAPDRVIILTDEASATRVNGPIGKGYMVNVAVSTNGVGFGDWTRISGWSEHVVRFIQAKERMDANDLADK